MGYKRYLLGKIKSLNAEDRQLQSRIRHIQSIESIKEAIAHRKQTIKDKEFQLSGPGRAIDKFKRLARSESVQNAIGDFKKTVGQAASAVKKNTENARVKFDYSQYNKSWFR